MTTDRALPLTYEVCSACGTKACADGAALCGEARLAPLMWADSPDPDGPTPPRTMPEGPRP